MSLHKPTGNSLISRSRLKNQKTIEKLAAVALVSVGAIITVCGLAWLISHWHFDASARHSEGVIISLEKGRRARTHTPEYPTIRFNDEARISHEAQSRIDYSMPLTVGARVPILYDPADFSRIMIDDLQTLWGRPVFVLAFGIIFLLLAIIVLRRIFVSPRPALATS